MSAFDDAVDAFLALHWAFNPVDASFAAETSFDGMLPPADTGAPARLAQELRSLEQRLHAAPVPDTPGARLDARIMQAQITLALDQAEARSRYHNPAWYTGEIAFGLIALLLPRPFSFDPGSFARRVAEIPEFLAGATRHLHDRAIPADWVTRARGEIAAIGRIVRRAGDEPQSAPALDALERFDRALDNVPDADPAAGRQRLAMLIRTVHGLDETPESLERRAAAAFAATESALREHAARLDPHTGWQAQVAALAAIGPDADDVLASYAGWHARALRDGDALLTPASEYALHFETLPPWARDVAADLYFLFYRSPAARRPGPGSTYWVAATDADDEATRRAHNTAAVKLIHAVHHGSIGHHTQNARARTAASRLAQLAGTDCASGIMFLTGGSMVEGWACYAEDLLAEVPDFYTPAELLQLRYFALRNIACCLADVRLHAGVWSLAEMRAFYRDEVAFAPARIWPETTRNAIFPASRLMYWTGTEQIKALRARSPLSTKAFHDRLLGFGSAPVAWIGEEMER